MFCVQCNDTVHIIYQTTPSLGQWTSLKNVKKKKRFTIGALFTEVFHIAGKKCLELVLTRDLISDI